MFFRARKWFLRIEFYHKKIYKCRALLERMARVISRGKSVEVADGSPVKEACKKLGIYFSCEDGLCATCMSRVLKGEENLTAKNQKEIDMNLDVDYRLMCQCRIKHGNVEVVQD